MTPKLLIVQGLKITHILVQTQLLYSSIFIDLWGHLPFKLRLKVYFYFLYRAKPAISASLLQNFKSRLGLVNLRMPLESQDAYAYTKPYKQ